MSPKVFGAYNPGLGSVSIPSGEVPDGNDVLCTEVLAGNPDIGKTLVVRLFGPLNPGPGQPYVVFDDV